MPPPVGVCLGPAFPLVFCGSVRYSSNHKVHVLSSRTYNLKLLIFWVGHEFQ
jgi:hypothetical protein